MILNPTDEVNGSIIEGDSTDKVNAAYTGSVLNSSSSNPDFTIKSSNSSMILKTNSSENMSSVVEDDMATEVEHMDDSTSQNLATKDALYFYALELGLDRIQNDDELKIKWDLLAKTDRDSFESLAVSESLRNTSIINSSVESSRKRDRARSSRLQDFDDISVSDKKKYRSSLTASSSTKAEPRKSTKEDYDKKSLIPVSKVYGRLIPLADGNFGHINCIRWCPNIIERGGYLYNAGSVKNFSHQMRSCAVCSQRMACLSCEFPACRKFFHFGCAVSVGCRFSEARLSTENGVGPHDIYNFMHCPAHADSRMTKPFQLNYLWKPTNPTRLFTVFDDSEEGIDDSSMESVVATQQVAVSRRLVSSSFGLSFTTKNSQRAVRSGGICASGVGFKGTENLLGSLLQAKGDL
jgi:hypothetical protein